MVDKKCQSTETTALQTDSSPRQSVHSGDIYHLSTNGNCSKYCSSAVVDTSTNC